VSFEGFDSGVDEQASLLQSRCALEGLSAHDVDGAVALTYERGHDAARRDGDVRTKATFLPSLLPLVDSAVLGPLNAELSGAACAVYPTLGVAFSSGTAEDPNRVASALSAARDALERGGGTLTVLEAPDNVRERVDVFGSLPPAIAIMRRIKQRFDPERRLNRGRFVGRL
jgi:glycolate oxidase FAD binding subunit